jgi:MoaA/NifB/PqqE/SkfB family radical SAM enzyme
MYKDIKNHVAVSSLESPLHATRKDPKIISVLWFIGKRCNYDCSYCSFYTHDNYSPHIKKEKTFIFLDQLEKHCQERNKKFRLSITGGEPFVHPDILEILKKAKEKINLTQLAIISNGSLPISIYEAASKYVTNMTISLQLEQDESIINQTVDKIIILNKIETWFFNVNLMAVSGKFDFIKNIIEKLNANNVKFVLRKIDPINEYNKTTIRKKDLPNDFNLKVAEKNFSKNKIKKKNKWNEDLIFDQYYSEKELLFLKNFSNDKQWKNIKLHFHDKQIELNTDELKLKDLNQWKGWKCYIGIDSIYVQHTGEIFRGSCMQGELIGRLGEKLNWPLTPIVCPIKWCVCNADMVVRKIKNDNFINLISD